MESLKSNLITKLDQKNLSCPPVPTCPNQNGKLGIEINLNQKNTENLPKMDNFSLKNYFSENYENQIEKNNSFGLSIPINKQKISNEKDLKKSMDNNSLETQSESKKNMDNFTDNSPDEKENEILDGRNMIKKLLYKRRLKTNKKFKYKVEEIDLTIELGDYEGALPAYVFKKFFYYTPHCCYQLTNKAKGYVISFAGLQQRYRQRVIENDQKNLYTYLFKQKRGKQSGLDIKIRDYKTLNEGNWIGDGIVNFYFKLIEDEYANNSYINKYLQGYSNENNKKNNVIIMKSYFYNMLSMNQNAELSNYFSYPDSCSFIVTKINVFTFKTMIIPICDNHHWSLIIVNNINTMHNIFDYIIKTKYNANYVYEDLDVCATNSTEIYPEIFYLDSYFSDNQRRINIILKYLFYEYQKIYLLPKGISYKDFNLTNFIFRNYQKIQCYRPEVPKQNNRIDCGIFILL